MGAFGAIVKKELRAVLRERTMIIAILIQLFVASFSSVLLMGMLALYDADTITEMGGSNLRLGLVADADKISDAEKLAAYLRLEGMTVKKYERLEAAKTDFNNGKLEAIFYLPESSGTSPLTTLKLYQSRSNTAAYVRVVLQKPLEEFENYLRSNEGIKVNYTDLKGKSSTAYEFIYTIILPILMFFPAFVAGGMVIDSLSEEVENNTLQTLLSAPLSITQIILAKISAALLLALAQDLIWLFLLRLNGTDIQNIFWIILLGTVIAAIVSFIAALVVIFFRDRERSQFIFSLALLVSVGLTYLFDFSPVKILARLAIADPYTGGGQVLLYIGLLVGLLLLLLRFTRRLKF